MSRSNDVIDVEDIAFDIQNIQIIERISFSAKNNEFVSVIGPSGCGKSTLLRIIAGLIEPNRGRVLCFDKKITEPIKEISFVFQDFALLPWLTNIENVKLGLTATKMGDEEKTKRAAQLLDSFGLGGFENSYPNILSGGMRQRIGIARAVASYPKVLLMDEPFGTLDELTANILRSDIIAMLQSKDIDVEAVIMVTPNVEEAVELSNKVVILSNKPSHVKEIVDIEMHYPRDRHDKKFLKRVDYVYDVLTK